MTQPLKNAKAQHAAAILALPDVVSVGIGKDSKGHPAIIIGLARPNPKAENRVRKILGAHPMEFRIVGKIGKQSPQ